MDYPITFQKDNLYVCLDSELQIYAYAESLTRALTILQQGRDQLLDRAPTEQLIHIKINPKGL